MQSEVTLEPFRFYQVPLFLAHAGKEGWRCEEWEFRFVLETFPSGCWVARKDGRVSGFVTSIKYDKSGWIGNLLVCQKERGLGLGRLLMERAMVSLADAGVSTMWLTASEAGRPLYEKMDFAAVDRIIRWSGYGSLNPVANGSYSIATARHLDQAGWGDDRSLIIDHILEKGTVVETTGGFCVVQIANEGFQLGPWGCESEIIASQLLNCALGVTGQTKVFLDVPERNEAVARILADAGFVHCGRTVLMCRGNKPAYRPDYIYALASMGSMG